MILTEQQIKDIILKNPAKRLIQAGVDYSSKLRKHFYGEKLNESMETIAGFETPSLRNLRAKYARSNKDLFTRIARPLDKVFSAKGGSIYFNLTEAQDKKARSLSSDIRAGYSIKAWIENFWKCHYLDDPNGVIFLEMYPDTITPKLEAQGKAIIYPTYKSISCIYDYLPSGSSVEYIVFEQTESEKAKLGIDKAVKAYRVIDDASDYIVTRRADGGDTEQVTILSAYTLPNYFGRVPAMLNSDIPNPNMDGNMLSFFDPALELAEDFLLSGSIRMTHKFLHGFPKYWEYGGICSECNGTRMVGSESCTACGGSGSAIMSKVSDVKILMAPQTAQDPVIAPHVAGYVSPDQTFHDISTADLRMLEDLMHFTLWGSSSVPQTDGMSVDREGDQKTATQVLTDKKPESDRLHPVTESAEKRHKFILDALIHIQVNNNHPGTSVNYGKRYMLEGPDVLWEKYQEARTKGAAASVLDDLLLEYYEAKYDSDPVKLAIQSKLSKVEPFVHLTAQQLKALSPAEEDYKAKLYFSEWLATLNEAMILSFSIEDLRDQLIQATSAKKLPETEPIKPAA